MQLASTEQDTESMKIQNCHQIHAKTPNREYRDSSNRAVFGTKKNPS